MNYINGVMQKPNTNLSKANNDIKANSKAAAATQSNTNARAQRVRMDTLLLSTNTQNVVRENEPLQLVGIHYGDFSKKPEEKRISENIANVCRNFLKGDATEEDLKQCFRESFEAIKKINVEKGLTTGYDVEDNKKILLETYGRFRSDAVGRAIEANDQIGMEVAKKQGFEGEQGWIYYDANVHYRSLNTIAIALEMTNEIAGEYQLGDCDTEPYNNRSGSVSFNKLWSFNAQYNSPRLGKMADMSANPPKGFTLFYNERKCTQEEYDNGTYYAISATNSNLDNGDIAGLAWRFKIPRGYPLLRDSSQLKLNELLEKSSGNGSLENPIVVDLNPYLSRYTSNSLVQRVKTLFFTEFTNPDEGLLVVGNGKFEKEFGVPFSPFDYPESIAVAGVASFDKSEIENAEAYNNFLSNFILKDGAPDY